VIWGSGGGAFRKQAELQIASFKGGRADSEVEAAVLDGIEEENGKLRLLGRS
jgi:hypothetical protein